VDVTLALLAALAFALGNVLQQRGGMATDAAENDPHFLTQLFRQPVWLAGALAQATGWVLQAAALDRGPLVVVQSLTSLSLVLCLPLGMLLTNQRVGRQEWTGAGLTVGGIVLFLSAGQPSGGTAHPPAAAWWGAGLLALVAVGLLAGLGRSRHGGARALFFGSAAGVAFALQAAVTKVFVGELGHGVLSLLASWSVYVLIVSAVVGFALQQSALRTGVLAPAVASSNSVTLFGSVIFGILVFGERLASGGGHLLPAVLGLLVGLAGVSTLAAAPGPEETPPDPRPQGAAAA
jgi:drug/metabolite transporter (DMT)-like permease